MAGERPGGPLTAFDARVLGTDVLSPGDRASVHALFGVCYRQADHAYLERSLATLSHVALAFSGTTLAGFALGDVRVMDLPRLPDTVVHLGGLGCTAPAFRRRGLFGALEDLTYVDPGCLPEHSRMLIAGRVAHPASMMMARRFPSVVPRRGVPPGAWHREVGVAIAAAYGVHAFDAATFVCIGDGASIGYPVIDVEAQPEAWDLFAPVDRDRGDALLTIAWTPDAPDGW